MYKLLIVDDDVQNLKATRTFLVANGYDVKLSSSANDAIDLVKEEEFALVLLDYQMPEMMGDALAALLKKTNPNQQIAMFSCDLSRNALKQSMRAGAVDFIDKSIDPTEGISNSNGFWLSQSPPKAGRKRPTKAAFSLWI